MSFNRNRFYLTVSAPEMSLFGYATPDAPEEVLSENYFLSARDYNIRPMDTIRVICRCNDSAPLAGELTVLHVESARIVVWHSSGTWVSPEGIDFTAPKAAPENHDERMQEIMSAIGTLAREEEENWTAEGRPNRLAVSSVLKWECTRDDVDVAWGILLSEEERAQSVPPPVNDPVGIPAVQQWE